MANLVETDIPQDGGPEVEVPGLGLQGLERLSAQGVLSLEVFLSVRIEPRLLDHRGELLVVALDDHASKLIGGSGARSRLERDPPHFSLTDGVWEGELSVESIAALPESADSALAAVVNFLVIMRPLTGRANLGLFFVAGNCGGFQAVKVAQNASEMKLKNPKSQYLLGFFGRARGGIGRRAGFRFRCLRA